MKPNDRRARQLLEKYLQGKCTPEEIQLLHRWYEKLDMAQADADDATADRLMDAIHGRIGRRTPVFRLSRRWAVAAAAVIGLTLTLGMIISRQRRHEQALAKAVHIESNDGRAPKKIILPDGSAVWLNTHSQLSWTGVFDRTARTVDLEGEAYFEVAKSASHSFIVRSRDVNVRVLGTTFNMETYPGEADTRVALLSGAVSVVSGESVTLLAPGQAVVVEKGALQRGPAEVAAIASWVSGNTVFQDLPLEDALHRLGRKFGYTIQGDLGRSRRKPVTATFTNESFAEILTGILYVNHLAFSMKDRTIVIHQ